MAALSGSTIASTFSELLRMGNSTLHATTGYYIKDAADTNSALSISQQRVGIGEAAPEVVLHISESDTGTSFNRLASSMSGAILCIENLHDTTNNISGIQLSASGSSSADTSATAGIYAIHTARGGAYPYGDLAFYSTNSAGTHSESMRIDSDGNVGIGEDDPDTLLELKGATDANIIRITNSDTGLSADDSIGGIQFYNSDASGSGPNIAASIYAVADGGSGDEGALEFRTVTAGEGAAATVAVHIDARGNVGIGDTTPAEGKLTIASDYDGWILGMVQSSSTDTHCDGINVDFQNADPDDKTQRFIHCEDSASARFTVYSDGDMLADGQSINSDERLKENIIDATPKLDDINKLKVRSFNFRETDAETGQTIHSKESASKKRIGFIAQEYEEVFPSLVRETEYATARAAVEAKDAVRDDKGAIIENAVVAVAERKQLIRKSLKWDALVPILVKAVQELSAKVDALENNNQQGESSNEQGQEEPDSGASDGESTGEDSGGDEGDNSDSSDATSGTSEASDSSSDDGDQSAGSSGSDASDDSEGGSGADDSAGSEGESSGDSGSDSVASEGEPSDEWTKDRLKGYMDAKGIEYNSGDTKQDLLDKIILAGEGPSEG